MVDILRFKKNDRNGLMTIISLEKVRWNQTLRKKNKHQFSKHNFYSTNKIYKYITYYKTNNAILDIQIPSITIN